MNSKEFFKIKNKIEYKFNCTHGYEKNNGYKVSNLNEFNNILNNIISKNNLKKLKIENLENEYDKCMLSKKIIIDDDIPDLKYKKLSNQKIISLRMQQLKVYMSNVDKILINKLSLEIKNLYNLTNLEIEKEMFKNLQYWNKIKFLEKDTRLRKIQISRNDSLIDFQNIYFNSNEVKLMNNFLKVEKYNNKFKKDQINKNNIYLVKKRDYLTKYSDKINKIKEKILEEYINDCLKIKKFKEELKGLKLEIENIQTKKGLEKKNEYNKNYINNLLLIISDVYKLINFFNEDKNINTLHNSLEKSKFKNSKKTTKIADHQEFYKYLNNTNKKLSKIFNKINNDKKIIKKPNINKWPVFYKSIHKSENIWNLKKISLKCESNSYNNHIDDIDIQDMTNFIINYYHNLVHNVQSLKKTYENVLLEKNKKYLNLIELEKQYKLFCKYKFEKNKKLLDYKESLDKKTKFIDIEKYFSSYNKINISIFTTITFFNNFINKILNIFEYIFSIENLYIDNNLIQIIKKIKKNYKENLLFSSKDNKNYNLNIIDKYFYEEKLLGLKSFWKFFIKSNIQIFYFLDSLFLEKFIIKYLSKISMEMKKKFKIKKSYSQLAVLNLSKNDILNNKKLQSKDIFNDFIKSMLDESMKNLKYKLNNFFMMFREFMLNIKDYRNENFMNKSIVLYQKSKKNINISTKYSKNFTRSIKNIKQKSKKKTVDNFYKDFEHEDSEFNKTSKNFNNKFNNSSFGINSYYNVDMIKYKNKLIHQSSNFSKLKYLIKYNNNYSKKKFRMDNSINSNYSLSRNLKLKNMKFKFN